MCAILASLLPATAARAYCHATTVASDAGGCPTEGAPLHWKRACISYTVGSRVVVDEQTGEVLGPNNDPPVDSVRAMIASSFQAWTEVRCDNRSIGLQTKQVETDDAGYYSVASSADINAVVFVNDWTERNNRESTFALTDIYSNSRTGEIVGVTIEVNETLGRLGDCCPGGKCPSRASTDCQRQGIVDLQNVVTHETGHFFGLGDEPTQIASTMYGKAEIGDTNKRSIEADDRAGICSIYPKGSLSKTCEFDAPYCLSEICPMSATSTYYGCNAFELSPRDRNPFAIIAFLVVWFVFRGRRISHAVGFLYPGTTTDKL